jgi:Ribbon-helix-helix protein, copG family
MWIKARLGYGHAAALDYTPWVCNSECMVRAQIVLDEAVAEQLRTASAQSGASMSEIVRQALAVHFKQRQPDLGWIGSLKPAKHKSHDLADIRASVAAGLRRESRR